MTIGQQKGNDNDSSDDESPAVGAAATDQLAAAAKEEQENARAKLLKKRIQVAEGERKALWQDCEEEKAENKARISHLKEEIKCLQDCMKEARSVKYEKVLTESNYERSKHIISAIKNMAMDEALTFLEYKKADKRKLLDRLEYELKQLEERLGLRKMELSTLKREAEKAKEEFENSPECRLARSLENKVYKTQANLTEAEHVFSKYKSIKDKLADESHNSQMELQELLYQIRKQEAEIERLKQSFDSALVSRDNLKASLALFETQVAADRQSREIKLNHLRKQMEEHQAKSNAAGTGAGGGGMLDSWGSGAGRKYSSMGPPTPLLTPSPLPPPAEIKGDPGPSDLDHDAKASEYFFGEGFDPTFQDFPSHRTNDTHQRKHQKPLWESLRETEIIVLLDNLKNRLGASTWSEMMDRCRDQESRKLHLQKVKGETLDRLAKLRATHDGLEAQRDQLKFRETEQMNEHRSDLQLNEDVIAEERSRVEECNATRQGIIEALTEIKQGAIHLLETLQPIPDDDHVPPAISLELQPEEIPAMLDAAIRKIESLQASIQTLQTQSGQKDFYTDVGSSVDTRLSVYNTRVELAAGQRSRHRSGTQSLASGKDKEASAAAPPGGAVSGQEQDSDSGEEQDIPTRVGIKRQSKKLLEVNKGQARAVAEKVAASKRR